MAHEPTASGLIQYGDLCGTIAVDGFNHASIRDIRGKCPAGYYPVGIELCFSAEHGRKSLHASFLAVDVGILDEASAAGVLKYAKQHGEIPVFRIRTDATLEDLLAALPKVKRLGIVLRDSIARDAALMLVEEDGFDEPDDEQEDWESDGE